MATKKRNKIEIIYDILISIIEKNNKIKITHIMYKANLSHIKLKEYLDELIEKDFIEEYYEKKQKYFRLTKKGYEQIEKIKQMTKFMEVFDI